MEVNHDHDLYDLKVKANGRDTVIRTTSNHPFWDVSQQKWVPAGKLHIGDHLKTADGTTAVADGGTTPKQHTGWMWDLTVPGNNDHDFYILSAQTGNHSAYSVKSGVSVLVHNCGTSEETVRMRHYTNSKGAKGIQESGVIKASDQNKVFMTRAKGKLLSPRDAESTLGIGRGRGNKVLEFDVPASRVSSRYNPIMGITEWVADGDLEVTNIKVRR